MKKKLLDSKYAFVCNIRIDISPSNGDCILYKGREFTVDYLYFDLDNDTCNVITKETL